MRIQATIGGQGRAAESGPRQLIARYDFTRCFHERGYQHELGVGQLYGDTVAVQRPLFEMDFVGRHEQSVGGRIQRWSAAENGANSGNQFARVEGFWQIVVGTHFQPHDAVHIRAAGGQHENGRRYTAPAQLAQDVES